MKVLITGGSGGIGLAIAQKLAEAGAQVTLVARNESKLQQLAPSLAGNGHDYLRADLSDETDIGRLANHIRTHKYDTLINNAGIGIYGRFTDIDLGRQETMLTLNINALMALSYAFLSTAKSGDALMNTGSTLGFTSFPGSSAYAATKGFVVTFSEGLWWEYKKQDIYVVALCPGATRTSFHEAADGSHANYPEMILQTPKQVADEAVRALQKRHGPIVISGGMNRMLVGSQRLMSRKTAVNIMGGFSPLND
ncbi:MAG: SDR family NAD(P)-dependent oxidoreductase [Chloroflexota bacterium]